MIIEIEPTSQTPIYLQLMFQIKKAIVKGELLVDETLPSVRSLASDLGVNMHTINKAYKLLADEAILAKSQKGYFIQASSVQSVAKDTKEEMKERLEVLLVDAFIHQVPATELEKWTDQILTDLGKGGK